MAEKAKLLPLNLGDVEQGKKEGQIDAAAKGILEQLEGLELSQAGTATGVNQARETVKADAIVDRFKGDVQTGTLINPVFHQRLEAIKAEIEDERPQDSQIGQLIRDIESSATSAKSDLSALSLRRDDVNPERGELLTKQKAIDTAAKPILDELSGLSRGQNQTIQGVHQTRQNAAAEAAAVAIVDGFKGFIKGEPVMLGLRVVAGGCDKESADIIANITSGRNQTTQIRNLRAKVNGKTRDALTALDSSGGRDIEAKKEAVITAANSILTTLVPKAAGAIVSRFQNEVVHSYTGTSGIRAELHRIEGQIRDHGNPQTTQIGTLQAGITALATAAKRELRELGASVDGPEKCREAADIEVANTGIQGELQTLLDTQGTVVTDVHDRSVVETFKENVLGESGLMGGRSGGVQGKLKHLNEWLDDGGDINVSAINELEEEVNGFLSQAEGALSRGSQHAGNLDEASRGILKELRELREELFPVQEDARPQSAPPSSFSGEGIFGHHLQQFGDNVGLILGGQRPLSAPPQRLHHQRGFGGQTLSSVSKARNGAQVEGEGWVDYQFFRNPSSGSMEVVDLRGQSQDKKRDLIKAHLDAGYVHVKGQSTPP
ncbi:MAG: hypothetical protein ACI8RA_000717 [Chlamydiales bacterium]|jgi:hypothetical protein